MDQDHEAPMGVNGDGLQHGGSIDLGAGSDGPPSILGVGPPSPLTGCYLLIIIGEPHSQDHKDIILQRLVKGRTSQRYYADCPDVQRMDDPFFGRSGKLTPKPSAKLGGAGNLFVTVKA
ncbi:hypothetical protein ZHAS_00011406 [Anopheles sinensis]|uniref:Uncharacterized protein n=1 Tax=Anopheles sinensis TaxID=74873 RepID=A0A084W0D4_ANOSI|nr:hypothetical protein ZHAS_00011406 [Anopheles sinensis]